jgi:hypothetical protein
MIIDKIEKIDNIYHVTFIPRWYEKLFGIEQKIKKFKDFGGGSYIESNGKQVCNGSLIGEAIDIWRRKF